MTTELIVSIAAVVVSIAAIGLSAARFGSNMSKSVSDASTSLGTKIDDGLSTLRAENREAHNAIGENINRVETKLSDKIGAVDGKVDKVIADVGELKGRQKQRDHDDVTGVARLS